jgi:glycosyltransferase involved in cell wall biosynthesis
MDKTKVSVIMPTHNHGKYIGEAIKSVVDQTYGDWELIVVDDCSKDNTNTEVIQFDDVRIKYILHKKNLGPAATRNTGIRASSGNIIAFLDADDMYHPEKLEVHVAFLEAHPEIDITYNSRFELNYSAKTIRGLVRPPLTVTLSDLVIGFPFATSDMVLRRERLFQAGLFDEGFVWSEELELNCKLAFMGCRFASVDRALNYRRFESGRVFKDLPIKSDSGIRGVEKIFADPRCPKDVLKLRSKAFANILLDYGLLALEQGDTSFGQKLVREVIQFDQDILVGKRCSFVLYLLKNSIADENLDHRAVLERMFSLLPTEMAYLTEQFDWAVAQGYILKGIRAIMWGRYRDGEMHFSRAINLNIEIDEIFLQELAYQLLSFEIEFGSEAAEKVLQNLVLYLKKLGSALKMGRFIGGYYINQAFRNYYNNRYSKVSRLVVKALKKDPRLLINRGVLSILLRSLFRNPLSRRI